MASIINPIEKIKGLGTIFSSDIESEPVLLNNYRYVDFLIFSGSGINGDMTVTIQGKCGESGEWKDIPFFKVVDNIRVKMESDKMTIGKESESRYRIDVDLLEETAIDRVRLHTTKVTLSVVSGLIVSVQGDPRYTK